ncbi:hypothetical protein [Methylobacterium aerolatum]|uniref:Uncharacterized protein n=1 Tax=Methylobacterium aerolatum TaxID=418708 RepID=A0ABU0HZ87_9HYPH|nr:hypothetical protein [Methylobacterium aerolatum]MDQ0447645.1 hypothetical protein [Methylobacterium aerolatum]GJD34745.1 hypothetical protein FMGBMHLM_1648 [Methylobacterium aerolatum]
MSDLTDLMDELKRSDIARDAMDLLESALQRRSIEERGAFWRAVDLYYFSRKAPPEPGTAEAAAVPPAE